MLWSGTPSVHSFPLSLGPLIGPTISKIHDISFVLLGPLFRPSEFPISSIHMTFEIMYNLSTFARKHAHAHTHTHQRTFEHNHAIESTFECKLTLIIRPHYSSFIISNPAQVSELLDYIINQCASEKQYGNGTRDKGRGPVRLPSPLHGNKFSSVPDVGVGSYTHRAV
jgi:hypothetical protein